MSSPIMPRHIAIIMDGNGRWAKRRHLPRVAGHKAGLEAARQVVEYCIQEKIQILTLFVFSSENWKRPDEEVSYLMQLFITMLQRDSKKLHEQNVQLRVIGDRAGLNKALQHHIGEVEKLTANNTGLILLLAANYGGQWDITEAMRKIAIKIQEEGLSHHELTETLIRQNLSFSDLPDPDLFIRTSGELRISNFTLWQLAYTELYFTDVLWPDFNTDELKKALLFFSKRERRFGHIEGLLKEENYA